MTVISEPVQKTRMVDRAIASSFSPGGHGTHCPRPDNDNVAMTPAPESINAFCEEMYFRNLHWWHDPATGKRLERNLDEMLMLVVSEVAEAMEGERKSLMDTHLPDRPMAEVELADVIIRLADIAGQRALDLESDFEDLRDIDDLIVCPDNKGQALFGIVGALTAISDDTNLSACIASAWLMTEKYCRKHGYDLWGAVAAKNEYNKHRADHKPAARLAAGGKKW